MLRRQATGRSWRRVARECQEILGFGCSAADCRLSGMRFDKKMASRNMETTKYTKKEGKGTLIDTDSR